MTARSTEEHSLDEQRMPVQLKLAAAWTSLMFLVIYIDYFHLYQPGEIDLIRDGVIFEFDISATLMSAFFVVIGIPTLMILLSAALPARANRVTNLVVAGIYVPVMAFNAAGGTGDWAGYYALTIGVELLILAYILRAAWTWRRASTERGARSDETRQRVAG